MIWAIVAVALAISEADRVLPGHTRLLRVGLVPLGVVFGVAVEWIFFDSSLGAALTVVDFAVGCVLIACGAVAWDRRAESRIGPLMTLAGFTWFVGNLGGATAYFQRGPLAHLVLSHPTGRLRANLSRAVVAAAYVAAVVEPLASNDVLTLVLAGAISLAACWAYVGSPEPARKAGTPALATALAYAAALALAAADRLQGWGHRDAVLLIYDLVVAAIATVLLFDLLRATSTERTVSGLVVDLGAGSESATLQARLARALGDPSLVLGYRLPETGAFVDDAGRPLALPSPGSGRTTTPLERDGEQIGVLLHDEALLADRRLLDSVAAATQLALANARLQAEAREQADLLQASRRRIVETTDRQRLRLERDLHAGPEHSLESATGRLGEALRRSGRVDDREAIAALAGEVEGAGQELREFAHGIRPAALTEGGLMPALGLLVERSPIPVVLRGAVGRLPEPIEAALYFVCSEGLANAAKHAQASSCTIELKIEDGRVRLAVSDDGVGGATIIGSSGLRGLADRLEALGGRLEVESPPAGGTRLQAELPLPA